MGFYTDKKDFTHTGRFYGIPVYLNLDDMECPVVDGQNIIYSYLFTFMGFIHNTLIEFSTQLLAAMLNYPYEPGAPFRITGIIEK